MKELIRFHATVPPLAPLEELKAREDLISKAREGAVAMNVIVGLQLYVIRERQLWRLAAATWGGYIEQTFFINANRARQLISAFHRARRAGEVPQEWIPEDLVPSPAMLDSLDEDKPQRHSPDEHDDTADDDTGFESGGGAEDNLAEELISATGIEREPQPMPAGELDREGDPAELDDLPAWKIYQRIATDCIYEMRSAFTDLKESAHDPTSMGFLRDRIDQIEEKLKEVLAMIEFGAPIGETPDAWITYGMYRKNPDTYRHLEDNLPPGRAPLKSKQEVPF